MALNTSSVMLVPSSYPSQLWIVGCFMKQQHKSHAIRDASCVSSIFGKHERLNKVLGVCKCFLAGNISFPYKKGAPFPSCFFSKTGMKEKHQGTILVQGHMSSFCLINTCPWDQSSYLHIPAYIRLTNVGATSVAGRMFNPVSLVLDSTKEEIRKLLSNVELSVSSYDTAWVAMIPSPNSSKLPCFPQCVKWVMDNQLNDGSWGLVHDNDQSSKDILSSTLASIVALKRWNVGEHQINKGLCFIESNFALAADKNQPSPTGFDIIFPHMLEYAKDLNIELPIKQKDLSVMLRDRELELRRCQSGEREAYMAYISEGLGNFYNRDMVMKYQMKNGSIFNSPSATAAALMHHQNEGCINYLTSLLQKFRNGVPTVYPFDLYARLSMVDELERLGIGRIFRLEIQDVLDETYRCWVHKDEQIFKDMVTCALAFRVLRTNGYEVSSDPLTESIKDGAFLSPLGEPFNDIYAALEVYRASQVIYPEEFALREQNLRSAEFLKQKIYTASNSLSKQNSKEVDFALKSPFDMDLERVSTRRIIENYSVNDTRLLKSTYRSSNISNKNYLFLAVEDFNTCQRIYQKELKDLERWVVENRLDQLKFARQKTAYCYFSVASTLSSPELSDARMSWAKNGILTTVVDDFFDVGGSMDELVNLIQCVERWNINVDTDCCSKEVGILFLALKNAICWISDRAYKYQSRDVTSHIAKVWLRLIKNMLTEAIWTKDGYAPTLTEYMENSHVTCALGPTVLSALYCVGPKLSEEIVLSSEYEKLYEIMSTQGRLLNDIVSFKREMKEGKLNALALYMYHGKSGIQEEEVVEEMKILIKNQRSEMRKLVLESKGSIVPRACKDVLWSMCNVLHIFYGTDDGFTENGIMVNVNEVIYEPIAYC